MLDPALAAQLAQYLTRLRVPIELAAALDDSPRSGELRDLLTEIAGMSDLISLRPDDDATAAGGRRPSFRVRRVGADDVEVIFAGIPLGHEFTSLVLALLQVGGHPSTAAEELLERARGLRGPHHFETFFSLSCQNCPDVVQALNLLSVVNPAITHVAIDGAAFPAEAETRGVLAVPTVFLDGEQFASGRMTLQDVVDRLDVASVERDGERLAELPPFDVLVVGGGPAGTAAAVYAARKGLRTGVVAERVGGQVLDTMAIENLIAVPSTDGPKLAAGLESALRAHDLELVAGRHAERLEPGVDGAPARVVLTGDVALSARTVVVATGARWRRLDVPGEEQYLTKGVTFCPHCDGPLFAGRRVAVVGGGNSGVEAAIDLSGIVEHVTLIEFGDQLRADAVLQSALGARANIDVVLQARTTEVLGDGARVTGLRYEDLRDGSSHALPLAGVFVQIGLLPVTDWLRGAVDLTPHGRVEIDARGATSAPGVFAAGDCTTAPYQQIIIALGAGATAALAAFDHLVRLDGAAAQRAEIVDVADAPGAAEAAAASPAAADADTARETGAAVLVAGS